jgi:hypothetical protein
MTTLIKSKGLGPLIHILLNQYVCFHQTDILQLTLAKGELEHKTSKHHYPHASKSLTAASLTCLKCRAVNVCKIATAVEKADAPATQASMQVRKHHLAQNEHEPLPYMDPKEHHHISKDQRYSLDICQFL